MFAYLSAAHVYYRVEQKLSRVMQVSSLHCGAWVAPSGSARKLLILGFMIQVEKAPTITDGLKRGGYDDGCWNLLAYIICYPE
jgi:hypothetical protein